MIKEDIEKLTSYLADEDQHFFENCKCPDKIREKQDADLCTCEENKEHIYKIVLKVNNWLNSPSCPLTEKDEI